MERSKAIIVCILMFVIQILFTYNTYTLIINIDIIDFDLIYVIKRAFISALLFNTNYLLIKRFETIVSSKAFRHIYMK